MNIGISGAPGSGKTTFANYLAQYLPDVYLGNIDEIYFHSKDKMEDRIGWKFYLCNKGDETQYNSILNFCYNAGISVIENCDLETKVKIALSKLSFLYMNEILTEKLYSNPSFVLIDFYLLPYFNEFCKMDYTILFDTPADIRYQYALKRIARNSGKQLTSQEKEEAIKNMIEYDASKGIDYSSMNYDLIYQNLGDLVELDLLAKNLAIDILKKYNMSQIYEMMKKEILLESSHSNTWNNILNFGISNTNIEKNFSSLNRKIKFLYDEKFIDNDMFNHLKVKCNDCFKKLRDKKN